MAQAIESVAQYGTIRIAPGTYAWSDTVNITDKQFILKAQTPGTVVFDGTTGRRSTSRRIFHIDGSDSEITFVGLTFKRGVASTGGAIHVSSAKKLIVKECLFIDNQADKGGECCPMLPA